LCPIFEILEEGSYRDTSAAKHPRATHALGVTFNGWARRPIDHTVIVDRAWRRFNSIVRVQLTTQVSSASCARPLEHVLGRRFADPAHLFLHTNAILDGLTLVGTGAGLDDDVE